MLKIDVILGSTRENRFSEQPGKWIMETLTNYKEIDAELIDLRDWDLPFYDEPAGGPISVQGNYKLDLAKKWANKIGEADGYILITPEYNHGYSAILKNALDYVYYEWNKKPVAFVAYGTVGGVRSVEQLRQVVVELQMVPLRNAVHIPEYWNLLDEDGKLKTQQFQESADLMIKDLIWWAKALQAARKS
jgi:NAD(P)H-dependent FMN reductase